MATGWLGDFDLRPLFEHEIACSVARRCPGAARSRGWQSVLAGSTRPRNTAIIVAGVGGSPGGDKDEACAQAGVASIRDDLAELAASK